MNCEIDGVKYVSAPDTDGCSRCVANNDRPLCQRMGYGCVPNDIIWLKAPPSSELTDDEILAICDKFGVEQKELIPCIRAAIEADRVKR